MIKHYNFIVVFWITYKERTQLLYQIAFHITKV